MSGSVRTRIANQHAERVTESGQLRLPPCWAAEPVKSSVSSSPADGRARAELEVALARLEHVGRLARAVGQRGEAGAHAALGVVDRLRHRRLQVAASVQLAQALDPAAVGGELRAQVGAALGRLAHLRDELVDRAGVERRGEITTPSSASVVESAGMLPGVGPPTSAWWARLAAKPSSVPSSANAGVITVMSGRWVPPR